MKEVSDYYEISLDCVSGNPRITQYHHDDGHFKTTDDKSEKGLPRRIVDLCGQIMKEVHPHHKEVNIRIEIGDK